MWDMRLHRETVQCTVISKCNLSEADELHHTMNAHGFFVFLSISSFLFLSFSFSLCFCLCFCSCSYSCSCLSLYLCFLVFVFVLFLVFLFVFLFICLRRAGVPPQQLIHFYTAVIRPVLEYASPVWHCSITRAQSHHLESVQK